MARERKLTERSLWSEKALEKYLKERVAAAGGLALKFASQSMSGYPDRLCMFPGGRSVWVELKSTGARPTLLQRSRMRALIELGQRAAWADTREKVDDILNSILDSYEQDAAAL